MSAPTPPDEAATRAFRDAFDAEPEGAWAAPGRVNVIGEHVDYNGGLCLPVALPQHTVAQVRRRDDGRVRLRSAQEPDEPWDGDLDTLGPGALGGWAAYAGGVLWALREAGHDVPGVDVVVDGDVPLGAGLSSSASLECAVGVAVADLLGLPLDDAGRSTLADLCVRAENEVAGAPTGGMDQAAAMRARAGHALLLDARSGEVDHVPYDLEAQGLALLVLDTRVSHALGDSGYGERRRTCEEAAATLGVRTLREVDDLDDALARLDDPVARRRVRHVVTEIARVETTVSLMRGGHVRRTGPLLDASHASLRDDYEVSSEELDVAVQAAREAGALGARMTGGGFGGSAVALVEAASVEEVAAAVRDAFARRDFVEPRAYPVVPSDGARRLW